MKQLLHLVQRQHVEVTDVILLGVSDPGPALLLVNHLSHVLADKLTLSGVIGKRKDWFVHLLRFQKEIAVVSHWYPDWSRYLLDVMDAAKAPTPGQRPEDLHLAVLALGEGLVQAPITCRTHLQGTSISLIDWDWSLRCLFIQAATSYLRVTLVQQHAVNALRVHPTWTLVSGLAVAAGDLWEVGTKDLNLSDRAIHLSRSKEVNVKKRTFVPLTTFKDFSLNKNSELLN